MPDRARTPRELEDCAIKKVAISVVLPTYNESQNITGLIQEIVGVGTTSDLPIEIIVVDDNSPDGTAERVRAAFGDDPRVRLIVREERGLATAVLTGFRAGIGTHVMVMDADLNNDARLIPVFLRALEDVDIVVGSRYVRGGGTAGSHLRHLGSLFFNAFARTMLRTGINDNTSGFFAARREVLDLLRADDIFRGYGDYCIRFLHAAARAGLRMREIPYVYRPRCAGHSKTRFVRHLAAYTRTVLELRKQPKRLDVRHGSLKPQE